MAISKERLEELIKQEAIIYILDFVGNLQEYQLGVSDGVDYWLFTITGRLFEQKQDGEKAMKELKWVLKYHTTRTEGLDLPMWEEFITEDKYNYYGTSYFTFDNYRLIAKLPDEDDDTEFIGIDVDGNTELYHWDEATEENYIKACDLCLKLFKGEE